MDLQDNNAHASLRSTAIMNTVNRSNFTVGTMTGSSCIMETVNGSYCFTINDYSLRKGIGVGNHLASKSFTVGGHQWAIYFYPEGKRAEDKECVSAYIVAFTSDDDEVRAILELGFLDPSIDGYHYIGQSAAWRRLYHPILCTAPMTMKNGEMRGVNQLCSQEGLERYSFLKNDTLQISCKVGVVVSRTIRQIMYSISVPQADRNEYFAELFDQIAAGSTSGDVTFVVEGEIFKAHKLVLAARSLVFEAQFYGPMRSENSDKIHVQDMVPPVFKALLHFIYKDVLPDTYDVEVSGLSSSLSTLMMQHLLVAADRYNINRLRLVCESKLCEDMNTDTVATSLTLAEQHHASQLKAHCLRFAAANITAVMRSDGFNYLKNSCPSLEWELLRAVADLMLPEKLCKIS